MGPMGRDHLLDVFGALGEEQPIEIRGGVDQVEEPPAFEFEYSPFGALVVLENIGHAGAKNAFSDASRAGACIPLQRFPPMLCTEETAGLVWTPNVMAGSFGECFGVAVRAGGGNFNATPPRVEGVVGPFDFGVFHKIESAKTPTNPFVLTRPLLEMAIIIFIGQWVLEKIAERILERILKRLSQPARYWWRLFLTAWSDQLELDFCDVHPRGLEKGPKGP